MKDSMQKATKQAAETHRQSLRQNLQRRLEAARVKGDERLVRLLEAEADYLRVN
ncbi:MAG: hypothetical protein AAFY11_05760 [Cyanobacteria bacterium J06641_5]